MKKRIAIIALLLALAMLFTGCGKEKKAENSTLSVRFIDVGQADAALISCDGHHMLIDGGNRDDSNIIYSILKRENITNLDLVVGTHGHEDHIGGLSGAFQYATADMTLCPVTEYSTKTFDNFRMLAEKKGGGLTVPKVGDTYSLGGAKVEILGLNAPSEDHNDTSIVLKLTHGEISFLFTGDAEYFGEKAVLDSGADLKSTVLKVGHHGSKSSTGYVFLREVMPEIAVICVGEGNEYGHPTETVLSRLEQAEATIYRTDLFGDVVITSDGKTYTIATGKDTRK